MPYRQPSQPHSEVHTFELTVSEVGGAERDRTVDPLLAKQVLSQLSYSPNLTTDINSSICFADKEWWAWIDSNYRPHPYQGCALAN